MRATVRKLSALLAFGALSAVPRGSFGQTADDDDASSDVYCEEDGSSAHYDEILSGSGSTMARYGASDTGCPNHVNWDLNPNPAQHKPTNTSIPAYPMMFESGGTTDLSTTANAVGIMRNGVVMFSAWARQQVVEYEDTAFYLEADSIDICAGHSTTEGTYHYHSTAGCLQEQAAVAAGISASEHSALLGWAYDGFPIYGQLGPDGVQMKMCDLDGADSTACLDVCSGYEALLPEVDDFTYRYYTSCGFDESFFPFTTNCFRGCCPDGVTCSRKMEACGDSPENGYTADYVPSLATALDEQYDTDLIEGDDTDLIGTRTSVDCALYMGANPVTTTTTSSSTPDVTPAPTAPPATPSPTNPPTPAPVTTSSPIPDPTIPPTPAPVTTPSPIPDPTPSPTTAPTNPPTLAPVSTSSPIPEPTPAPSTPAPTTAPINPPTPAPTSTPTPEPTPVPITPAPTTAPSSPPTPFPVSTSSPILEPTPAPSTPAPTTAPTNPPTPAPTSPPTPEPTPGPTAPSATTAPVNPPSPAPVTTPSPMPEPTPVPTAPDVTNAPISPPTATPVSTSSPVTFLTSAPAARVETPSPIDPATPAPAAVSQLPTAEPTAPVASTLAPVSQIDSETTSDYNDDNEYVEVGTKTTVEVAATAYDEDPGEVFGSTGCGTDGCLPALAHDGDSSGLESRWSCTKSIIPDGDQCEITFTFGEPMDLKDVQVAFYKGEERTRWLKIRINGDVTGTFESYTGSIFSSFDIEETEVESVTMESVGIATAEWISFLEVRFLVEP